MLLRLKYGRPVLRDVLAGWRCDAISTCRVGISLLNVRLRVWTLGLLRVLRVLHHPLRRPDRRLPRVALLGRVIVRVAAGRSTIDAVYRNDESRWIAEIRRDV